MIISLWICWDIFWCWKTKSSSRLASKCSFKHVVRNLPKSLSMYSSFNYNTCSYRKPNVNSLSCGEKQKYPRSVFCRGNAYGQKFHILIIRSHLSTESSFFDFFYNFLFFFLLLSIDAIWMIFFCFSAQDSTDLCCY